MATVSGNCFLQNQSDHSGAMVLFEALSPSAVTDSVFTSEVGSYEIGLSEGIYAVHFSKDDFYPYTLPGTPTYATDSYTIEDVELVDGGSLLMVSGEVSGEWTSDVLYLVEGDIQVAQGETLMIHAGTTVKFMGSFNFQVYGDLYVMGEEGNMVTFTSGEPMPNSGDWQGIYLYNNDSYNDSCSNFGDPEDCDYAGCSWYYDEDGYCYQEDGGMRTIVVQYATIEYGQYGLYAQDTHNNNITILNNTIQHSSSAGIYTYGSDLVISGNTIDNNDTGISVEYCSPIISGNNINDNHYGIYVSDIPYSIPGPVITTNTIENNDQAGIYFQSADNITISGNTIGGTDGSGIEGVDCYYCNENGTITITENLVENNYSNGLYFETIYNADISNNVVRNNDNQGVYLHYIQNSTVSHNTIYGNDYYGMSTEYGENSKLMHNIITGNNYYGIRMRSWNGGIDFSYNNVWDNNNGNNFYSSDDSPPELGNMITTNANGTDCDTYNNISENPLFVNPPINVDDINFGYEVNFEDSTVHYELLVPHGWGWNEGYIGLEMEYFYYSDWFYYDDEGSASVDFNLPEMEDSTEYYYEFEYHVEFYSSELYEDSDSTSYYNGNVELPQEVEAAVTALADSLYNFGTFSHWTDFVDTGYTTIALTDMDDWVIYVYSEENGYYNPGDPESAEIQWGIIGQFDECYGLNNNWDISGPSEKMEETSPNYYEITLPLLQETTYNHCDGSFTSYEVPTHAIFAECDGCWNGSTELSLLDEPNSPLPENFFDPPDFNLLEDSPCIDAGSSAEEYYDPDGTIADMGAYPFFQGTPLPPEIDFSASTTNGTVPLPVQFSHLNTGGPITSYSWNFGDDATSTSANPVHTYMSDEAESFSVSLTVEGPGGADVIEYIDLISVIPVTFPPVSNFTANTQVSFGDVEFTAQANGQVDSYSWDFGDENTSSDQNPFHSYSEAGTYSVSLTVSGPTGSDTETKTDYIQILSPETVVAGFELASNSGIAPFTAIFTNTSMGSIEGYQWNFGDGETSDDTNPTHTYTDPGSYIATLIVTGMINSDTTSQEITAQSAAPMITSISDVPDDQGGRVYVSFAGSGYDTNTPNRNEQYAVERQDNDIWVNVGSGPAYGESSYTFEVTTLSDSTGSNNAASNFRIIASMDEGIWISETSSGYSIDNLAPPTPQQFSAYHEDAEISIHWEYEYLEDLSHHALNSLYSDNINTIETFVVTSLNSRHEEYRVFSEDYNGNSSDDSESTFALKLHAGANLISANVLPEDLSIGEVLNSLEFNANGIIGEGTAATYLESGIWVGSLTQINGQDGYWLMLDEEDILLIVGEPTERGVYELHAGNNLISYPYRDATPITDAIPDDVECSISGIIGEGQAATQLDCGNWVGSLTKLEGSYGYWFMADEAVEFSFDGCDSQDCADLSRVAEQPASIPEELEYTQSTRQAFYFFESIENIEIGDFVLAYNGDVIIGAREWTGAYIDVPAMGDDDGDYSQGYINAGEIPQFKVLRNGELINMTGDIPEWSNNEIFMVSSLTEAKLLPEEFSLEYAYPNPFNPSTTLNFALPLDREVSIAVYNLQGREIATLISGNMDAGYHSVVWNADSHSSGVYFVKMTAGEYVNTQKLMLVK